MTAEIIIWTLTNQVKRSEKVGLVVIFVVRLKQVAEEMRDAYILLATMIVAVSLTIAAGTQIALKLQGVIEKWVSFEMH